MPTTTLSGFTIDYSNTSNPLGQFIAPSTATITLQEGAGVIFSYTEDTSSTQIVTNDNAM
jgi:hypothetical protein